MRGVSVLSSETLMPSSPLQQEPDPESAHRDPDAGQRNVEEPPYTPETNGRIGYNHYLDLLDFKRGTKMRQQFESLLVKYHNTPHRRYLRKNDGDEFTALINGFLDKHGATFFGERQRSHLVMPDPTVGLLYHKNGEAKDSHLWRTLAEFFNWRSRCALGGKNRRRQGPERENEPEPPITGGQEQGLGRKPLKQRGRPPKRRISPDGQRVRPLRKECQGRDHAHILQPTVVERSVIDLTASEDIKVEPEPSGTDPYETRATSSHDQTSLPTKILNNTNLLVRVSNQPDIAPALVNLRLCRDMETLFPILIAECDVRASSVAKITKISVTFPWNREELRLRKGRREDWVVFCEALRQRWQKSEVVEGGTCRVEMLVHVDN